MSRLHHGRLKIARKVTRVEQWPCRICGGTHWDVCRSEFTGDARQRERVCLSCKEPLRTLEIPVPDGFTVMIVPIPSV